MLKKLVVNIKNKILSLSTVTNQKGSREFSEILNVNDDLVYTGFFSTKNKEKLRDIEATSFEDEKESKLSKEEMSSITFDNICKNLSFFNLKFLLKPGEWDAFFEIIYDHLVSKNLEKDTGRLMTAICTDLMMNKRAWGIDVTENTITLENISDGLEAALNRIMQYGNYYKLTNNDCYKITNRIRMLLKKNDSSVHFQTNSKPSPQSTECQIYNFEDYFKKNR